jgi:hypothetical protein
MEIHTDGSNPSRSASSYDIEITLYFELCGPKINPVSGALPTMIAGSRKPDVSLPSSKAATNHKRHVGAQGMVATARGLSRASPARAGRDPARRDTRVKEQMNKRKPDDEFARIRLSFLDKGGREIVVEKRRYCRQSIKYPPSHRH